jgi:shikimate dehydrogenase
MKLFAVIGNPISHSRSPLIHNSAFKLLGLNNYCYTKVLLENAKDLRDTILRLGLSGVNITVPFKEEAFRICDEIDEYASSIGAVNTIIVKDNKLHGKNSDAPGFSMAIEEFEGVKSTLILGAGGTARAVAVALRQKGLSPMILNRSSGRLEFFIDKGFECSTFDSFIARPFDLVINTTSAGLSTDELPCDSEQFTTIVENARYGVDVIYGKKTAFLREFEKQDKTSKDGSDMLLYQAFIAFESFCEVGFDKKMVLESMRKSFLI